jgi:tetratricopeptide (TPR) repeat protein
MQNRKLFVFKVTSILLPFIIFFLVEISMRIFSTSDKDPYLDLGPLSFFEEIKIDGEKYYKLAHFHAYKEKIQTFALKKPPGTIRIFCLGGSASASWPHPAKESCSYYLEQALKNAFSQNIEVLDVSGHGFASFRVRSVFDKILQFDPDVLLLYCGNNEFLENRTYHTSAFYTFVEKLSSKSKIVTSLRDMLFKIRLSDNKLENEAITFWKKIKKESLDLRKDPRQFQYVMRHYQQSIGYILEKAAQLNIPVIIYTIPVNLRDWIPNVSYHRLGEDELPGWHSLYYQGLNQILQNNFNGAIDLLHKAIEIEPEHAESYFWLANAYEKNGDNQTALTYYIKAKDLDYNPFRAHSDINKTIRMLADTYDQNTHLLDLEEIFIQHADNHIPGFDLFLDYVHPAKKGNLIIAENVFRLLLDENIIPYQPINKTFLREDLRYPPDNTPYDEKKTYLIQLTLFDVFTMNHQYNTIIKQAMYLKYMISAYGGMTQFGAEIPHTLPQKVNDAYQTFTRYYTLKNYEITGKKIDPAVRKKIVLLYDKFYEKYYSFDQFNTLF